MHIYKHYHCTHKSKTIKCRQGSIREEELYKQLDNLLMSYDLTPELYEWGLKALDEIAQKEIEDRNNIQDSQHDAIQNTQAQLDRLLDLATGGFIDAEKYKEKSADLEAKLKNLQDEQAATSERTRNWYEIVGATLTQLESATEYFHNGDISGKRNILSALGSDPVLKDGKLIVKEHFWLQPLKENKSTITEALEKVQTSPQQIKNTSKEAIYQHWCGYRESDPGLILGKDT